MGEGGGRGHLCSHPSFQAPEPPGRVGSGGVNKEAPCRFVLKFCPFHTSWFEPPMNMRCDLQSVSDQCLFQACKSSLGPLSIYLFLYFLLYCISNSCHHPLNFTSHGIPLLMYKKDAVSKLSCIQGSFDRSWHRRKRFKVGNNYFRVQALIYIISLYHHSNSEPNVENEEQGI